LQRGVAREVLGFAKKPEEKRFEFGRSEEGPVVAEDVADRLERKGGHAGRSRRKNKQIGEKVQKSQFGGFYAEFLELGLVDGLAILTFDKFGGFVERGV
jgi:hypothetical protein